MDGDDLWIGTYTGGVNVLNTKTGVFRVYTTKREIPLPLIEAVLMLSLRTVKHVFG